MPIKIFITLLSIIHLLSTVALADATRVTSQTLGEISIYPESTVPATALSINDSKISAEVSATVNIFPVLVGDIVKRGEVLIQLDKRDHTLNLLRAKTALKGIDSRLSLANYQLDQAKSLSREKVISDEVLQKRKSDVRAAKAERDAQKVVISMAERDLEKCTITAPFDAIVVERIAQVGELASPGSPLVRIIDASRIEVSAKLQTQDIQSLQQAKNLQFYSSTDVFNLKLRKITPAFDPVQRNREARFLFTSKKALAGATGTIRWKQSLPHIPANILIQRKNKLGVFVIRNDIASFVAIKDAQEGRPAITGLPADTKLVINGRFSLQDGMSVSIDN